jgi:hypothetical protein
MDGDFWAVLVVFGQPSAGEGDQLDPFNDPNVSFRRAFEEA